MLRTGSMSALIAAGLVVAPAQANVRSESLHLRVGPGVTATITTATMRASCGDDADCRFDVPANASFDIVATGRAATDLRWTGCNAQPQPGRCRVEMRGQAVLVTVR